MATSTAIGWAGRRASKKVYEFSVKHDTSVVVVVRYTDRRAWQLCAAEAD